MTSLSRRELLVTAGGIVLAGSACTLPDTSGPGAGDLDLNTPEQNLRAFIRMQGSLREEDVPWWYNGTIYGVIGEEKTPRRCSVSRVWKCTGSVIWTTVAMN